MTQTAAEPRVVTIEGRRALVVERRPDLPLTLNVLLNGGRDPSGRWWPPFRLVRSIPLGGLLGSRPECAEQDHRLLPWVRGFSGSPASTRLLDLHACRDCGAVCVRDVSVDDLTGLPPARHLARRRRDLILGWYSGARPGQREYHR